jgi:hypothetical protein
MAEIGHGLQTEWTFRPLHEQLVFLQLGENKADVAEMFRQCLVVDQYVLEEHQNESAKKWVEHFIHEGIEGRRCVHQAERYNEELEEALVGPKGHLLHVIGVHPHLVITETQVKLREKHGATQLIK